MTNKVVFISDHSFYQQTTDTRYANILSLSIFCCQAAYSEGDIVVTISVPSMCMHCVCELCMCA